MCFRGHLGVKKRFSKKKIMDRVLKVLVIYTLDLNIWISLMNLIKNRILEWSTLFIFIKMIRFEITYSWSIALYPLQATYWKDIIIEKSIEMPDWNLLCLWRITYDPLEMFSVSKNIISQPYPKKLCAPGLSKYNCKIVNQIWKMFHRAPTT